MTNLERIQSAYETAVTQFIGHHGEEALYSVSELGKEMVRARLSPDILLDVHAKTVRKLINDSIPPEMGRVAVAANEILVNSMMAYAMNYHGLIAAFEAQQRELEAANKRLQEIDTLKSMFIATMSHELRTPLNSIIGFTSVIMEGMAGDINSEQREQLGIVNASAHHLLNLINDIIDISKIEANRVDISLEPFDLPALIRNVADSFAVAVKTKGLELRLAIPEKLVIASDEHRIRQVLINLVNNAIKFTDAGFVTIELKEENERVAITVRDSGIGISAENMERLFKAFSQITNNDRPQEGSGLGLYLCRKICDLLGGEISVASDHIGSTFTFSLPSHHQPDVMHQ